ncbi:MAG: hypothetical protein RBS80_22950 [Thermoguttaceae bacterium]|jgi:hypothetical protein|nr:hypothetical protein [Thermoguttaceae bacterium]
MTTRIDRYERREGRLHDSLPIDQAAAQIAASTGRDSREVTARLRAGDWLEGAVYFYRLSAMRPAGL